MERLRCYTIRQKGKGQVRAKHSEAVRQCSGICLEERFFFDRVALHYTGVAPGNVQGPASVVANLADARLALRDGAAVTTGKTADPVAVKFLVEFALVDVLVDDIPQRRHTPQPKPANFQTPFYLRSVQVRGKPGPLTPAPDSAARQPHSPAAPFAATPKIWRTT